MSARFAVRCDLHKMIDGQLNVTRYYVCGTRADLEAGKVMVSIYKGEAEPGVTAEIVRKVVAANIGNFPNVRAVRVIDEQL